MRVISGWIWVVGVLGTSLCAGCGDKVTVNGVERGLAGESCRSRNDCESGLMCVDMVCTAGAPSTGGGGGGSGDAGVIATRSELGESCQTRADCVSPLVCIGNTCLAGFANDAAIDETPSGKRGESCQASNDCEPGLACIGSRCLESDFDLEYIPKQCYRVQCETSDDCCDSFQPLGGYTQAECDAMRTHCETAGVYPPPSTMPPAITFNDCASWVNYCRCASECVAEQCVPTAGSFCLVDGQCFGGPATCVDNRCAECMTDVDCVSVLEPFCSGTSCVQCLQDDDCTTPGSRCVSGSCIAGCTANEHCGLMEKCEGGECVDAGCTSDRQCYFLTGDDRSRCVESECQTPCERDAECVDDLHICDQGVCVFAGCESDEECRAVLGLASLSSQSLDRAVCRAPE